MVKVDKEKCIGCGLCENVCLRVFELDDEGKAGVRKEASAEDKKLECVGEAKQNCPVGAIS